MSMLNVPPPQPDYSGYSDDDLLNEVYRAIIRYGNEPLRLEQLIFLKNKHVAARIHGRLQANHIIEHEKSGNFDFYKLTSKGYDAEAKNLLLRCLSRRGNDIGYDWQELAKETEIDIETLRHYAREMDKQFVETNKTKVFLTQKGRLHIQNGGFKVEKPEQITLVDKEKWYMKIFYQFTDAIISNAVSAAVGAFVTWLIMR